MRKDLLRSFSEFAKENGLSRPASRDDALSTPFLIVFCAKRRILGRHW